MVAQRMHMATPDRTIALFKNCSDSWAQEGRLQNETPLGQGHHTAVLSLQCRTKGEGWLILRWHLEWMSSRVTLESILPMRVSVIPEQALRAA